MTPTQALAVHLGWDSSELKEYRYHPGKTNGAVYSIGDGYMAVTKGNKKPPTHNSIDFEWKEKLDTYLNSLGFKIWQS